jgi:hypothetical protein
MNRIRAEDRRGKDTEMGLDLLFTIDFRRWSGEASGNGLWLSSAIRAPRLLRWAALGFVRSAPQLLHESLSVLNIV